MNSDEGLERADLISFYNRRISEYGCSYQALWGDAAEWKSDVRFAPSLLLPIAPGDTIVDIGCGTAALAKFLKARVPSVRYIGIEVVPGFAQQARAELGVEIVELDGFRDRELLPAADWYVTFGTLNKDWCLADLPGATNEGRVLGYLEFLYKRARKGVAASLVTNVVEYSKPEVCNLDPARVADCARNLSPHFMIYHGYPFYEFFAAVWRGTR